MDVLFVNSSVYDLPSSRRVGAHVYGGTRDLKLWPGPGPDKKLLLAYGPKLPSVLEGEVDNTLKGELLPPGGLLRLHPGKLHCDFLVWVGLREPEPKAEQSKAATAEAITKAVDDVLSFVAERGVVRVAFSAFATGASPLPDDEQLAVIVRAANAYAERTRAAVLEEVLVCDASSATIAAAKRKVAGLAKHAAPEKKVVLAGFDDKPEKKAAKPRAASAGPRASRKPVLSVLEVQAAMTNADPYDRARTYAAQQWLLHPKFGAGKVLEATQEGAIMVLFEDGEIRKMLHAHAAR